MKCGGRTRCWCWRAVAAVGVLWITSGLVGAEKSNCFDLNPRLTLELWGYLGGGVIELGYTANDPADSQQCQFPWGHNWIGRLHPASWFLWGWEGHDGNCAIHSVVIPGWMFAVPPLACIGVMRVLRRPGKGTCVKCGYDLSGLPGGVCPECGTPFHICAKVPTGRSTERATHRARISNTVTNPSTMTIQK